MARSKRSRSRNRSRSRRKSNVMKASNCATFTQVDPASISWHNIEVYSIRRKAFWCIPTGPKSIKIVKNVSGRVRPGTTLAIMGASGAGKTTLLNVLTARNLAMVDVSGVVKINDNLADVQTITKLTAYVQQMDLFIPILTVREHLIFQAMVRMDRKIPMKARAARIHQVMVELSLLKCADTLVGGIGFFKGISGGEMKRLSFAVEILTNPAIMFCDEPTSGLDASMAENLVAIIKRLAMNGRTIICTIHQPSTDVFSMFDQLLLLADGRVAYMGELIKAPGYFRKLGYTCPTKFNPADFYVKLLGITPGEEVESRNKINMICDYYQQNHPEENLRKMSSYVNVPRHAPYTATRWQQWKALAWRANLVAKRQPILLYIRLLQGIIIACLLGIVYFKTTYDNFGVINFNSALFLLVTNMVYQNALAVINTFCLEIPVFVREHSNGQYGVAPYFFTKNLAEMPVFVLIPIAFVSIYYYMVGFTSPIVNFLFTMFVGLLASSIGVAFGYFISCVTGNADIALAILPPLLMPFSLFGGYYVNSNKIPSYFAWARTLSFFRYSFDLLMYNQWTDVSTLACVPSRSRLPSGGNGTQLPKENAMCFKDGDQVMDFYAIQRHAVFPWMGILLFYNFLLRFMGYLALCIRTLSR